MRDNCLSRKKITASVRTRMLGEGLIILGAVLMFVNAGNLFRIIVMALVALGIILAVTGGILIRRCKCPYCGAGSGSKSKDRQYQQAIVTKSTDVMCPECKRIIKIK